MKPGLQFSKLWSDLLAYFLFPLLCVVTPAPLSLRILRKVSAWRSVLKADAEFALAGACRHLEIGDSKRWMERWKQVELLDVRDLYLMLTGRSKPVLAEIELPVEFGMARDRVMVGMHWGPAISILKLLADAGMQPTFPYRPPEREVLRIRPFYYLYCRLAARYLSRTLGERAVTTGGAGKVLRSLLDVPGSICVLMDAPAQRGRPARERDLLGAPALFNVGFPEMFIAQGKEFILYAMNLEDDGSVRKRLEFQGPFNAQDTDGYLDLYVPFLDRHLAEDSAQWRIWRAEPQVWGPSAPGRSHQ